MLPNVDSYINIHSHSKPKLVNEFVLRNAYLALSESQLDLLPYSLSVGLHPWFVNRMSIETCTDKLVEAAVVKTVLAIGEIGIDRAIEVPIHTQLIYFEAQLNIARALQKPVIIHAVRSYSDIIPYLKKSKVPFIFHQFSGNKQQASELLKYNAYLSFGKNLFDHKAEEIFPSLPLSQVFLETDTAKHLHIADIYQKAAELKKMSVDELKSALFSNFAQIIKP
jgi:TatD DNase family protein